MRQSRGADQSGRGVSHIRRCGASGATPLGSFAATVVPLGYPLQGGEYCLHDRCTHGLVPSPQLLVASHNNSADLLAWCCSSSPPQALGINDDSLGFVLGGVVLAVGFAFAQWQSYQDDDEDDFFDTYDSRRVDRESSNRNRV